MPDNLEEKIQEKFMSVLDKANLLYRELKEAVSQVNPERVKTLLEKGADPRYEEQQEKMNELLLDILQKKANKDSAEIVKLLAQHGANLFLRKYGDPHGLFLIAANFFVYHNKYLLEVNNPENVNAFYDTLLPLLDFKVSQSAPGLRHYPTLYCGDSSNFSMIDDLLIACLRADPNIAKLDVSAELEAYRNSGEFADMARAREGTTDSDLVFVIRNEKRTPGNCITSDILQKYLSDAEKFRQVKLNNPKLPKIIEILIKTAAVNRANQLLYSISCTQSTLSGYACLSAEIQAQIKEYLCDNTNQINNSISESLRKIITRDKANKTFFNYIYENNTLIEKIFLPEVKKGISEILELSKLWVTNKEGQFFLMDDLICGYTHPKNTIPEGSGELENLGKKLTSAALKFSNDLDFSIYERTLQEESPCFAEDILAVLRAGYKPLTTRAPSASSSLLFRTPSLACNDHTEVFQAKPS